MNTLHILLWYGTEQKFTLGRPQRWINLLGTVNQPHLEQFTYRVNGGAPHNINIGPDGYRLRAAGDFNAEIPVDLLADGPNTIDFLALDGLGQFATKKAIVHYNTQKVWELPTRIHWPDYYWVQDAVQLVDGYWFEYAHGIRTANPAYDRLVALGDRSWTDIICRATITLHGFVDGDQGQLQGGIGVLTRWTGHYPDSHQPSREWRPSGAIGWYRARWEDSPARVRTFNISDAVIEDQAMVETPPANLELNRPAVFEMSVRSQPHSTSLYRFRVWYQDTPQQLLCDLQTNGTEGESPHGSLLFIALYADVTIGDVEVRSNE